MAYSTKDENPLLDNTFEVALWRLGKMGLGIVLLALALVSGVALLSYSPLDPHMFSAADVEVRNWAGPVGATIVGPFMQVFGWGFLSVPVILAVWGLRFVLNWRAELYTMAAFILFSLPLASAFASGLTPLGMWTHDFGMGGSAGDFLLGWLMALLPLSLGPAVNLLTLVLALVLAPVLALTLGFRFSEQRAALGLAGHGAGLILAVLARAFGRGAMSAGRSVRAAAASRAQRQPHAVDEDDDALLEDDVPDAPARRGLRLPRLFRSVEEMPEPELPPRHEVTEDMPAPEEERLRSRISDAVRQRLHARRAPPQDEAAEEPPTLTAAQRAVRDRQRREPQLRGPALVVPPAQTGPATLGPAQRPGHPPEEPAMPGAVPEDDVLADQDWAERDWDEQDWAEEDMDREVSIPHELDAESWQAQVDAQQAATAPRPALSASRAPASGPSAAASGREAASRPAALSRRAEAVTVPAPRSSADTAPEAEYELPPLDLLMNPDQITRHTLSEEALESTARQLEAVLDDYGIKGEIVSVRPGPVVTMYELEPAPGLKASRVIGLADDIARSMSAMSARVSTVPGRSVIGIELPNSSREMVALREILNTRQYESGSHRLPLALGKDIGGDPIVANLAKMPHLLIAGTTGSGKSVAINTMILSLLYKLPPEDCRLIMIDPKMLELSVYDGIPHLLSPVVTDPKKAVVALKWVVAEMEDRYRKMSKMGVRNIDGYNSRVEDALSRDELFSRTVQTGFDEDTGEPVFETEEFEPKKIPYIVVIVDEMADLMMVAGKEIEACIQRLAQMARASGIHIIMATQRPSVDVITGTIKANFPTRISFHVTSKIDSRTILGEMGAEQLLGMGDMLYMPGGAKIVRCHGPFVSDEEVEEVVRHLKAFGPPDYVGGVQEGPDEDKEADIDAVLGLNTGGNTTGEDALYDQAVAIVLKDRKCSTSYIQRKLGIGYNKAARLVEQMETEEIVSAANHVGKRQILVGGDE